jgi:Ni/Co efflux regulator RcnB
MDANNHMRKLKTALLIVLMLGAALAAAAQDPAQLKAMFARAQQQNADALKHYAWKSRNEVRKNGESKNTQLFLMRHDAAGNLQQTQIGGSAPPAMPKGPIVGRIAQKKKEDFLELIHDLREQVQAYSHLPPEKMQAFLAGATITAKPDQGAIQIQGGGVLRSGDAMTIWLDAKTRKQRRAEIHTFLKQNPVKAAIEFRDLPAGPTYLARTVVDFPKDALQLITENFDHERENR